MMVCIRKFISEIYHKIINIHDTPHSIAAGLALGVFLGIIPGAGPLASLTLAYIFKVNKAAALIGSLATNTWISFVIFAFSVKAGAMVCGRSWEDLSQQFESIRENFHWGDLLTGTVWGIVLPVMVGYVTIALGMAVAVYFFCLPVLLWREKRHQRK